VRFAYLTQREAGEHHVWEPPPQPYFESIAQLVPLLFLAAVYQARSYDSRIDEGKWHASNFLSLATAMVTFTLAEFSALASIVDPSEASTVVATGGVAVGLTALLTGLIASRVASLAEHMPSRYHVLLVAFAWLVAVVPLGLGTWGVFKLA
jgi:hypothetical protein